MTPTSNLDANGKIKFNTTDLFAFCSQVCHDKAIKQYLPANYEEECTNLRQLHTLETQLFESTHQRNAHTEALYRALLDKHFNELKEVREAPDKARAEYRQRWNAEQQRQFYDKQNALLDASERRMQILKERWQIEEEAEERKRQEFEALIQPRSIPEKKRYEHTHILAPSGFGKTTLLQQIILDDLAKDEPPAYVVIDPKGELVNRLSRLKEFEPGSGRLADKLIIIDPTQDNLPALNMFSLPTALTGSARDRVLNHLIETFAYVFSSAEAALSQRQGIPFSYVMRLVFSMGGDLNTLMDVLEDTPKERRFSEQIQRISKQDDGARRFFEKDFYSTPFEPTRQQIRTRLFEIISKPELMKMFTAPENKLSIFDSLQSGKIVLINTAFGQLGRKASTLLGRYFIALTLNAAFTRFTVPKHEWRPACLVIDEFQDFADEERTPELLRLAREYNLGVTLAHQQMHCKELNDAMRNSISTNTSIKYASNPEGIDRPYVARDLNCDQEFLRTRAVPFDNYGHFACFVRGIGLEHPFLVGVKFGNIDESLQMGEQEHARMVRANAERLSMPTVPISNSGPTPASALATPPSGAGTLAQAPPAPGATGPKGAEPKQPASDTEASSTW